MNKTQKALIVATAGAVIGYGALIAECLCEGEFLGAIAVVGLLVLVLGIFSLMYHCSDE